MRGEVPPSRRVPRTARAHSRTAEAVAAYLHDLRTQAGWTAATPSYERPRDTVRRRVAATPPSSGGPAAARGA